MSEKTHIRSRVLAVQTLAALGIVYGDIGTSPLYALRVCFSAPGGLPVTPGNIIGVLSLICWSLFILISVKYISLVLRADNRGEGGILALMALVQRENKDRGGRRTVVMVLGLMGAALLYGDGLLTPAISVLSAVEGLKDAAPVFKPYIVPLCLAVLVGLFWVQHNGTQRVGSIFGPIMILWFLSLGILGLANLIYHPKVLAAVNPLYAVAFIHENHWRAFVTFGAVFLVITGGEALYADMGHFGRRPIRLGWFALVLPALILNYLGQGAVLLQEPAAVDNLFYRLAPPALLLPLVGLSTMATVIASQAVISGVFSLTRQAMQLGFFPRQGIVHTSKETIGQVYLPSINWFMLAGTVILVLWFQMSDRLAGAYGLAVSGTMLLTTLLMAVLMVRRWHWHPAVMLLAIVPLAVIDTIFVASNLLKIKDGGWVAVGVAAAVYILMDTWHRGRDILYHRLAEESLSMKHFLADVAQMKPLRVPGVAAFLSGSAHGVPRTLLHNFKHNKILHESVVLMSVQNEEIPHVPEEERMSLEILGHGFYRIRFRYGFSENPDLILALQKVNRDVVDLTPAQVAFFLGRETLLISQRPGLPFWRKQLFSFLARNAQDASKYFHLPPNRVIEIGIQVEL